MNKELEKLKKLAEKVDVEKSVDVEVFNNTLESVGIEGIIRKVLKEELEIYQERLYKGLSKIIFGGRDEIKAVDAKLNKLLKLAEVDGKQGEIVEYIVKLNELMGGGRSE